MSARPAVVSRRSFARPGRQRGFSLIELVAAFMVFALAFGVLMQLLSGSLKNTRLSSEYTQAALWAQSKLDIVGIGEKLEEGRESGRFDKDYRWNIDITKYEPPDAKTDIEAFQSVELYRVDLEVTWGGRPPHSAHFVTLRPAIPDGSNGGAGTVGAQQAPPPSRNASLGKEDKR
jgi:general secretion pathway protein I